MGALLRENKRKNKHTEFVTLDPGSKMGIRPQEENACQSGPPAKASRLEDGG